MVELLKRLDINQTVPSIKSPNDLNQFNLIQFATSKIYNNLKVTQTRSIVMFYNNKNLPYALFF